VNRGSRTPEAGRRPRWLLGVALACALATAVGALNLRALIAERTLDPTVAGAPARPAAGGGGSAAIVIPSPAASSSPSRLLLPSALPSPPSLAGLEVFDYTSGAVDPSLERLWAQAALNSDSLRLLSIRLARADIAMQLFVPGSPVVATDGLLPLVRRLAADGRPVVLTGTPRWLSIGVYRLEPEQKAAFARLGVRVGDDALMLSELGPVTVSDGEFSTTIVPGDNSLNMLMPGTEVHDPQLGDLWQAAYTVECRAGDPEVSLLCTGH
jgi:hypothetical protein